MQLRRRTRAIDMYGLLRRFVICAALLCGLAFWLYALLTMMAGAV